MGAIGWLVAGGSFLIAIGGGVALLIRLAREAERREVENEESEATIRWHEKVQKGLVAPVRAPDEWADRMREARLRREAASKAGAKPASDDPDA